MLAGITDHFQQGGENSKRKRKDGRKDGPKAVLSDRFMKELELN